MASLETVVKHLLIDDLGIPVDLVLGGNLLSGDILDSFDRIRLIELLEERFSVPIAWTDMVPKNFDCVDSILKLLDRLGLEREGFT